jgi:hypothetical protein
MKPRLLKALNVNDRDLLSPAQYRDFIEVQNVQSAVAVQDALRSAHSRYADLFLIDVDMQHTRVPKGLQWGDDVFRLYGPILALPFLDSTGVSAFFPYSSFWGETSVSNNGFVLVAVSILLSQMYGRPFSLSDVQRHISSSVSDERSLVKEAETALLRCLELFRSRLDADDRVQFVDVEPLIERLQDLEASANAERKWPLSLPLTDAEGVLGVDIVVPPHVNESVQLGSLFADSLGFKAPQTPADLTLIFDTLERWKGRSVSRWGDTLYKSVVGALNKCGTRTPLNKAASTTAFVKRGGSAYQVIRLAMEFAWVRAWRDEPQQKRRTTRVHEILGLENPRTGRVDKNAGNRYKRFLGTSSSKKVDVSAEPWRAPFWATYAGVSDAYKLDTNASGTLTPFERSMCIKYAVDELDWDALGNASEQPYPLWMT